jgi:Na+:H+ antiporter, NhaA family
MAESTIPTARATFLHSDRALARAAQPVVRFLRIEAAGGILLLVATVVALVWANSAWQDGYESFWATSVELEVGSYRFEEDLAHLVNDLLMALFFFVVGMEIKREMVVGELRDRRSIALPALAALGGMVVPAAIFAAVNAGGAGASGWGIPMATDIAFALGVVALVGDRVPPSVKVLLLTLAIVDDLGAIAVIAVFYADSIDARWLVVALAVVLLMAVMRRIEVTYTPVLVAMGATLWLAVYESGVHATIAGVAMGLLTPARPRQTEVEAEAIVDVLENRQELSVEEVRSAAALIKGSVSDCDRLIDALHPWTSFVIVPVFALANAGIVISGDVFADPSAVFVGVSVGLVVGKFIGITLFCWLAVKLRLARLPDGAQWSHIIGVGAVAGIGFTVSLFIAGLAFDDSNLLTEAKVGILVASAVSALGGSLLLRRAGLRSAPDGAQTK